MDGMSNAEMIRFLAEQHAYDRVLRIISDCETKEQIEEKIKALLAETK